MAKQMTKEEVRDYTTNRVLEALKGGKIPWNKPWTSRLHNGMFFNSTTDKLYNGGVNQILLNIASMVNGYSDPRWMGRTQALKKGYNIRGLTNVKGTVIFLPVTRTLTNDEGEKIRYCKGFRQGIVFNAEQLIEGPPPLETLDVPVVDPMAGYTEASDLLNGSGVPVYSGGDRAFYRPSEDMIQLPKAGLFDTLDGYWSTALHELVHSTGHTSRLNRGLFGQGKKKYAFEELVAEMGSAFLCAWVGIDRPEVTRNHEAYIQGWIEALDNDTSVFMDAAALAWNAFKFLTDE